MQAQINFSTERPTTGTTSTTNTTGTTTTAPTTNTATPNSGTGPIFSAQIQPQMLGIPLFPGASMHMQPFPIEIRGISHTVRPSTNNNAPTATTQQSNAQGDHVPSSTATSNSNSGTTTTNNTAGGATADGAFNLPDMNNPNVEFFMEVTPESITIDSLETTLVGSNTAGDSECQISSCLITTAVVFN